MYKKYALMMMAVAVIIPISVYAVDQVYIEIAAKERLQELIDKLHADIAKGGNAGEIERLEKLLAGAMDLKNATQIAEQLSTATGGEQEQLLAHLKEAEAKLREHAGSRTAHTVIVPEEQNNSTQENNPMGYISTQSAWIQNAYATNEDSGRF